MRILKCDLCKKKIKREPVTAGVGFLSRVELCEKCGKPIINFLKKNKVIKIDKDKKYVRK